MTDSTSLREAAHAAYLDYCERQTRMRAIEWRDRVYRANKEVSERLGLSCELDWQPSDAAPVKMFTSVDGIILGAEFSEGECFLRVNILSSEGENSWPIVYDLADLGRYLAEDEESHEYFERIAGEVKVPA